jgi:hypothetical protein
VLEVTSTAFRAGGRIPKEHTGDGADTSPPLAWSATPAGTAEIAVLCDDPDAPRADPWVHWVVWGIAPESAGLSAGASAGFTAGRNDFSSNNVGWRGPAPPRGHGTHHYHFHVYALSAALTLRAGHATKADLLAAIKGRVLAHGELVGTYERA